MAHRLVGVPHSALAYTLGQSEDTSGFSRDDVPGSWMPDSRSWLKPFLQGQVHPHRMVVAGGGEGFVRMSRRGPEHARSRESEPRRRQRVVQPQVAHARSEAAGVVRM